MKDRLFFTAIGASAVLLVAVAGPASATTVASVPPFVSVANYLGPAPLTQLIHLVVHLPYPNPQAVQRFVRDVNDPASRSYRAYLTPARFAGTFGPSPHSYSTVEYVAGNAGMNVLHTYANHKIIDLVATVAEADALFGTVINQYSYNGVVYYANGNPAQLPKALEGTVLAVSGFTNFLQKVAAPPVVNNVTGIGPGEVRTAYDEPIHHNAGLDGAFTTVAIETAYDYLDSDLTGYLAAYGIARTGSVKRIPVADPVNQGLPLPGQSDETTLDVEQVAANAPGANVLVYEAADTLNSTFDDLYEQTVENGTIDVVTTSFGNCEAGADPSEVAADEELFQQAAAQGQTRFAASGDYGSHDCGQNDPPFGFPGYPNPNTVDFPASSPYVAGVGGTVLTLSAQGGYVSETAWWASGGGVSTFFATPFYQRGVRNVQASGRNVPDVALDASPKKPYALYENGTFLRSVGGTSAAAPNLAALYAQVDEYAGVRQGLAQTGLYGALKARHAVLHDVTTGRNGRYPALPGYDQVTGVGSLDGYTYMLGLPQPARGLRR